MPNIYFYYQILISKLYLVYTIPHDLIVHWICCEYAKPNHLYIGYTRHILFFLLMYLVYPWNIFLRQSLTLFIPVLQTPLRYLSETR